MIFTFRFHSIRNYNLFRLNRKLKLRFMKTISALIEQFRSASNVKFRPELCSWRIFRFHRRLSGTPQTPANPGNAQANLTNLRAATCCNRKPTGREKKMFTNAFRLKVGSLLRTVCKSLNSLFLLPEFVRHSEGLTSQQESQCHRQTTNASTGRNQELSSCRQFWLSSLLQRLLHQHMLVAWGSLN